ncbi:hypothetical protein JHK87_050662 [Glycine soja]|nr:hypothetical protein JHK87_050662 [Glycine soja]
MDRMAVHSTIDLSNNVLCGKIPDKLTEIIHLGVLNLSWNKLTGNIHNNIGSLKDLESLYLSHNRLSGNPQLCGNPLPTNCSSPLPGNRKQGRKHEEDDDKTKRLWLYGSIALGDITGFWLICGSLVLKRPRRHAYFKFVFPIRDKLLVLMAIHLARAERRFGLERN